MKEYRTPELVSADPGTSITDLLVATVRRDPDAVLLRRRVDQEWADRSAADFLAEVAGVAKGFIAAGIRAGDRVGIMSRTRYEWTVLDFALWHAGAVPVPVYETSAASQAEWILSDSLARAIVVETAEHARLISTIRASLPELRNVWQIDADSPALVALADLGSGVSDAELESRHSAIGLDDLATIIYTSGTTGRPKGTELTHGNFVRLSLNAIERLSVVVKDPGACTLLFMPLAHVFARFVEVLVITAGATLGHAPDVKELVADLGSFRPTFILSVPRVFEKVYNSAEQKAIAGGKVKIFHWAARVTIAYSRGLDNGGPPWRIRLAHRVADALVLRKLRAVLGGRARWAISGGAPLGERLGHFYRGLGLTVLEGYGLTETTAPATVNVPERTKIGTVGLPLPGTGIRIGDDGEVLITGIHVFRGYHNSPEATAEAFTGQWFHSGDIGELDDDGYLRITGRKKELIITAGGKNVAPAVLEDRVRAHPLVSQCVVVGDNKPFIAALITLDAELLESWLAAHGRSPLTVAEATTDPTVRAALDAAVARANEAVSRAESIRAYTILDGDFTIANGYLTPSLKVIRHAVLKDFASEIDQLYPSTGPAPS
jgi:long-chain acyl-CoA synthetase